MNCVERRKERARSDRQETKTRQQQRDKQARLPRQTQAAGGNVGVPIAEQQCGLEEHQAGGPDGGGASEAWKNQLGEQWL